jgi:protein involved in ribonucleotide reduction
MSQIKINILKQGIISQNVISCSFFTMKDSYRQFSKYENNLKRFLKQTEQLPNFEVRIYTDDTGKDFVLDISQSYSTVSVYHYNCSELREETGHIGTFGTLVRFLPMFENLDIVWISDIDIPDSFLNTKLISLMEKNNCSAFIQTLICYERKVYGRKYTITADRMIFRFKFPKVLLSRFITKLINDQLKPIIHKLNVANISKPESKVPYGIDEVFINSSIYDYMKKQSLKLICQKDYFMTSGYYKHYANMPVDKQNILLHYYKTGSSFSKVKEIFKQYVPNLLTDYPCFQELLDNLSSFKHDFIKTNIISSSHL